MMLSFLFVLPSSFSLILGDIQEMITQEFPESQEKLLVYSSYESIVPALQEQQDMYDTIFFGGPSVYRFAREKVRQTTHWVAFPRSSNNILRAIAELKLLGVDITRLSIDSYSQNIILEAYRELHIPTDRLKLQIYNNMEDKRFPQKALQHHIKALKEGLADGCATASIDVANEMHRKGLTCVPIIPTHDVIRAAVSNAMQYHRAKSNAKAQIAVIYININFPPEHSLLLSDEYSFMLQKMGITKEIYKYADRISASVAEESLYNFILFTTRGAVELETDQFQKFELLRWMQDVTDYTISIGVGNGETATEARHNAFRAMLKAKGHAGNTAYVMLVDGAPVGPYTCEKKETLSENPQEAVQHLARQAGISANTIHHLYNWSKKIGTESFTSKELSDGMKISKRSADRLLEKLLNAGLASLENSRIISTRGRPARIIRLHLPSLRK